MNRMKKIWVYIILLNAISAVMNVLNGNFENDGIRWLVVCNVACTLYGVYNVKKLIKKGH